MAESRLGFDGGKVAYRLAVLCVVGAAILGAIAAKSYTRDVLTSKPLDEWRDRIYSRLWFAGEQTLMGAAQKGSQLVVEELPPRASSRRVVELGNSANAWVVAPDGSSVAWASGTRLYWRSLERPDTKATSITLEGNTTVSTFSILPDHTVEVLLGDGRLDRWDVGTGRLLGQHRIDAQGIDQAAAIGDYLAVASTDSKLLLYRLKESGQALLVEESRAPDPPFQLVIPAPGRVAMLTSGGVRIAGETRNTPGRVGSLAFGNVDQLIAAGDFEGAVVLRHGEEPYRLADAAPGSVIAANASRLAVSGPRGTSLVALVNEKRLTVRGKGLSYLCLGLAVMAVIMALSGFSYGIDLRGLLRQRWGEALVVKRDPSDIPPELARFFASGETVLWAGAGLSMQSGFPARQNFIVSLIQTAQIEEWVSREVANKLAGMVGRGDIEDALNHLIASAAGRRNELLQQFRVTFVRTAALSRAHQALAQLPLAGAITTNYDSLLERMGAQWAGSILTLGNARHVAAAERGQFFVLKLWGDFSIVNSVALCRAEFESALASDPKMKETLARLFSSRSVLFVGCSLEGLLADLKAMGVKNSLGRKHYAVAAVSSNSWKKRAAELAKSYGIEVLAFVEEGIGSTLPEFLSKLAAEVERSAKGDVGAAVEAAVK